MAILVRERELREEVARLTRENSRLSDWTAMLEQAHAGCANLSARVHALTLENARLIAALKARGIHDRKCGSVTVPGRFGSQEGLRWNQSTDPTSCTCPLGVAILGCELGKTPAPDKAAIPQPAPDVQTALADALEGLLPWAEAGHFGSRAPAGCDCDRCEKVNAADAALLLAGRKP